MFLQQTTRMFTLASATPDVGSVNDMQIGDFNGDTVPDLVFATAAGKVRILLTTSSGGTLGFDETTGANIDAGTNPVAVAVGDLDGGALDVAAVSGDEVRRFHGDGDGGLTLIGSPLLTGNSTATGVLIANVDTDDRNDIITTDGSDGSVTIFLSSAPAPTVTLTPTLTGTITQTPTITPTITVTPTPGNTGNPDRYADGDADRHQHPHAVGDRDADVRRIRHHGPRLRQHRQRRPRHDRCDAARRARRPDLHPPFVAP